MVVHRTEGTVPVAPVSWQDTTLTSYVLRPASCVLLALLAAHHQGREVPDPSRQRFTAPRTSPVHHHRRGNPSPSHNNQVRVPVAAPRLRTGSSWAARKPPSTLTPAPLPPPLLPPPPPPSPSPFPFPSPYRSQDVEALCALLTRATQFTELDLGYNRIDDAGCVALQKFLEVGCSCLSLPATTETPSQHVACACLFFPATPETLPTPHPTPIPACVWHAGNAN